MNRKKVAIICVDDEPIILRSLKIELQNILSGNNIPGSDNYLIETAENGKDALELLEDLFEDAYEVPLVISDYIMPGLKGDEVLKQIYKVSPHTLSIMLTGHATLEGMGNAVNNARLYSYLAKPWREHDLALTVKQALEAYMKNRTFEKFVPCQFLSILGLEEYTHIQVDAGIERQMTVLFSDIRSFTTLSENMTPQENFRFVNEYLGYMGPPIRRCKGFIDKFIGDAIMALFEQPEDALQAGLDMLESLDKFNAKRQQQGYSPINIGIGINSGKLMLGTVGEADRLQTTVIGDTVNLAARVESLTKEYRTPLLLTEYTIAMLNSADYPMKEVDKVVVKGKTQPVTVYCPGD